MMGCVPPLCQVLPKDVGALTWPFFFPMGGRWQEQERPPGTQRWRLRAEDGVSVLPALDCLPLDYYMRGKRISNLSLNFRILCDSS